MAVDIGNRSWERKPRALWYRAKEARTETPFLSLYQRVMSTHTYTLERI